MIHWPSLHATIEARPFPHCVLTDLFEPEWARALYGSTPERLDGFTARQHLHSDKYTQADLAALPRTLQRGLLALQTRGFLGALETLTGLPELLADRDLYGGGLHVTIRNGFLDPHCDQIRHPGGLSRALNLLVYLSPWQEGDGGELELWTPDLQVARVIPPRPNTAVLFETSDRSWHSVRAWRGATPRVSLALYYYRQAPGPALLTTQYRARPEQYLKRARKAVGRALRAMGVR